MVIDETSILGTETHRLYCELEREGISCDLFAELFMHISGRRNLSGVRVDRAAAFKRVDGFFRALGCVPFFEYRDMQSELSMPDLSVMHMITGLAERRAAPQGGLDRKQ